MDNKTHFALVVLSFVYSVTDAQNAYYPDGCDDGSDLYYRDGVVHNISMFQWLGLLQIRFKYDGNNVRMLNGILLIHEKFAIAHAEDLVASLKPSRSNIKALFITKLGRPWVCKVKSFTFHPEAFSKPVNKQTIALVHLIVKTGENIPVKPICWPTEPPSKEKNHYVVGYTVGNISNHIKKVAVQVDHLNRKNCSDFYSRNNMKETDKLRSKSQCFFAKKLSNPCLWDSGMILVTNSTGPWTPVGLGIGGAGCRGPARFFKLALYWDWIDRTISSKDILKENIPPIRALNQQSRNANADFFNAESVANNRLFKNDRNTKDVFWDQPPQYYPGMQNYQRNVNAP